MSGGGREKETETERDTETERQRQRETQRQRHWHRHRDTQRATTTEKKGAGRGGRVWGGRGGRGGGWGRGRSTNALTLPLLAAHHRSSTYPDPSCPYWPCLPTAIWCARAVLPWRRIIYDRLSSSKGSVPPCKPILHRLSVWRCHTHHSSLCL